MNNILCPVDFSDASLTAVEFAVKIAKKHSTSMKLIHIVSGAEYSRNLDKSQNYYKNIEEGPGQKLKVIADEINDFANLDYEFCSYEVTEGDLIKKISQVTENDKISLIVMGTTGVSDVREASVGSNTVKVIEHTTIPVICIPAGILFHNFDRIVYGSGFSGEDREFLQSILNFSLPFDARIYVVHITNKGDALDGDEYQNYVKDMDSYFVNDKLGFEQFVTDMETGAALEHMLHVRDAHLLILVHKSRNFIGSFFHRSLSKRMSCLTNYPLLILRN